MKNQSQSNTRYCKVCFSSLVIGNFTTNGIRLTWKQEISNLRNQDDKQHPYYEHTQRQCCHLHGIQ
jgi:hypothetical protein